MINLFAIRICAALAISGLVVTSIPTPSAPAGLAAPSTAQLDELSVVVCAADDSTLPSALDPNVVAIRNMLQSTLAAVTDPTIAAGHVKTKLRAEYGDSVSVKETRFQYTWVWDQEGGSWVLVCKNRRVLEVELSTTVIVDVSVDTYLN